MINICPNCRQRYASSNECEDFEHACHSNLIKENEDVLISTKFSDYSGSGNYPNYQFSTGITGLNNADYGLAKNERITPRTVRGNNANLTRSRKHFEFIKHQV